MTQQLCCTLASNCIQDQFRFWANLIKTKKENDLAIWPQPNRTVSAEPNKLNKSNPNPNPNRKKFLHLRPPQRLFSYHVSCADGLQPVTELCELWSLGMKTRQSNCSHKFKHAELEIDSVFPPVSDDIDCVYSSCCSNLYDSLAYSTVGCILYHRVPCTGSRLGECHIMSARLFFWVKETPSLLLSVHALNSMVSPCCLSKRLLQCKLSFNNTILIFLWR